MGVSEILKIRWGSCSLRCETAVDVAALNGEYLFATFRLYYKSVVE